MTVARGERGRLAQAERLQWDHKYANSMQRIAYCNTTANALGQQEGRFFTRIRYSKAGNDEGGRVTSRKVTPALKSLRVCMSSARSSGSIELSDRCRG